jgi:cytidylate kinase
MTAVQILRETASAYGITVAELKSKGRKQKFVRARIDAAQRIWLERGLSSGEMAKFLNRSPWTCRYYFNRKARTRHQTRKREAWRKKHGLQ